MPSTRSRTSSSARRSCTRRRCASSTATTSGSRTRRRSRRRTNAVSAPAGASSIVPVERQAAIVGVDGAIGGFTPLVEWVAPDLAGAKSPRLRALARADRRHAGRGDTAGRRLGTADRARGGEHAPPSRRPHRRVMRVAIVGAGVMGCATAWALTEAGADVTVYEQFELDNTRGSSHGRSRIFRVAYPDAVLGPSRAGGVRRLARPRAASPVWSSSGFYGLVELAADPSLTSARALDECGVPYRLLDAGEVRALGAIAADRLDRAASSSLRASCSLTAHGTRSSTVPACGRDHPHRVARRRRRRRRRRHRRRVDRPARSATFPSASRARRSRTSATKGRRSRLWSTYPAPPAAHSMYALHDPVHGLKAGAHHAGAETDPDEAAAPTRDRRADRRLGRRALPRRRRRAGRDRHVRLHDDARPVLRARAARPRRRRLAVLRPRLQVRARGGAALGGPGPGLNT